jgi:hypothetical protein
MADGILGVDGAFLFRETGLGSRSPRLSERKSIGSDGTLRIQLEEFFRKAAVYN